MAHVTRPDIAMKKYILPNLRDKTKPVIILERKRGFRHQTGRPIKLILEPLIITLHAYTHRALGKHPSFFLTLLFCLGKGTKKKLSYNNAISLANLLNKKIIMKSL